MIVAAAHTAAADTVKNVKSKLKIYVV
jgi:hypothetical protein